jgi:hypothetical protein
MGTLRGMVTPWEGMVTRRKGMVTRWLLGRFRPWTREEAEDAELHGAEDARHLGRAGGMTAAGTYLGSSHSQTLVPYRSVGAGTPSAWA